jgi:hypothetical protein
MEQRWNDIDRRKAISNASFSTTKPIWTDLGTNPACLAGGRELIA